VHGPIVVRRRLGAMLKRLRGEVGLHLDAVARQLEISPSKLSRLETGQVAPKIRDVRDLLEMYDAPVEVREQMMHWTTDAKEPGWWQPYSDSIAADLDLYISLEAEAMKIKMFAIPIAGLLQTEARARMMLSGVAPDCSPISTGWWRSESGARRCSLTTAKGRRPSTCTPYSMKPPCTAAPTRRSCGSS